MILSQVIAHLTLQSEAYSMERNAFTWMHLEEKDSKIFSLFLQLNNCYLQNLFRFLLPVHLFYDVVECLRV